MLLRNNEMELRLCNIFVRYWRQVTAGRYLDIKYLNISLWEIIIIIITTKNVKRTWVLHVVLIPKRNRGNEETVHDC